MRTLLSSLLAAFALTACLTGDDEIPDEQLVEETAGDTTDQLPDELHDAEAIAADVYVPPGGVPPITDATLERQPRWPHGPLDEQPAIERD